MIVYRIAAAVLVVCIVASGCVNESHPVAPLPSAAALLGTTSIDSFSAEPSIQTQESARLYDRVIHLALTGKLRVLCHGGMVDCGYALKSAKAEVHAVSSCEQTRPSTTCTHFWSEDHVLSVTTQGDKADAEILSVWLTETTLGTVE